MSWRGERAINGLVREARRDELLVKMSAAGPRAVYCGCLDFAIRSGSQKAAGYAAHLFLEIFGTWPRSCDRGPPAPLPDFLIEEWVAGRKRKARPRQLDRIAGKDSAT